MSGYEIAAGVVVGIWLFAVVVFFLQARDAVEGWQDDAGFHYGTGPRIDDERND